MSRECTTHHAACDCREAVFAELLDLLRMAEGLALSVAHGAPFRPQKFLAEVRAAIAKAEAR